MHDVVMLVAVTVEKSPRGLFYYLPCYHIPGNISAFVSFWLVFAANIGIFGFLGLVVTIFLADTTGDLLWYSLGRSLRGTNVGFWLETHIPWHDKIEAMVQRKGQRWIFLSKFAFGFALPVMFSIGWSGMEFKKFYKNSLLSTVIWLPVIVGLSYGIVSGLAPLAATDFRKLEWVALGGFVLFIILDFAIAKGVEILAKRFLGSDDETPGLTN